MCLKFLVLTVEHEHPECIKILYMTSVISVLVRDGELEKMSTGYLCS